MRGRSVHALCASNCLIVNLNRQYLRAVLRSHTNDSSERRQLLTRWPVYRAVSAKQPALTHIMHFYSELKVLGDTTYNRTVKVGGKKCIVDVAAVGCG